MAFTLITVTGTYLLPTGAPASGSVSFTLTAPMRDATSDVTITPQEQVVALNASGSISINLYANDDDSTVPDGVTYEVNERLNETGYNKYYFTLNSNSPYGRFDLADVAPNTEPIVTYNYATKEYVDSHIGVTATDIIFTPTSEITSTTVQAAIEEVRAKSKYVHTQGAPSTTWSVTHNLKFYPNVSIVDSALSHVMGEVTYINENSLTVSFTSAFSGKAFLS
jgi:hypothetical protein